MWHQTNRNVCANLLSLLPGLFSLSIQTLLTQENRRRERRFIQKYTMVPFLASGIHKYLTGLFLKASFSSLCGCCMFTCVPFLYFCLKPHFKNTVYVSIMIPYSSVFCTITFQPALWSILLITLL